MSCLLSYRSALRTPMYFFHRRGKFLCWHCAWACNSSLNCIPGEPKTRLAADARLSAIGTSTSHHPASNLGSAYRSTKACATCWWCPASQFITGCSGSNSVAFYNPWKMSDYLAALINDPSLNQYLSEQAHCNVQRYTWWAWRAVADRFLTILLIQSSNKSSTDRTGCKNSEPTGWTVHVEHRQRRLVLCGHRCT